MFGPVWLSFERLSRQVQSSVLNLTQSEKLVEVFVKSCNQIRRQVLEPIIPLQPDVIVEVVDPALTVKRLFSMAESPLFSQLLYGFILDQAIAAVEYTALDRERFCQQLDEQPLYQVWLRQQGVTPDHFEVWMDRELRIRKFQQKQWGKTLYSYFLQRKYDLDRVIYSRIRLQDQNVAQELYFRLIEEEQSFTELAHLYSEELTAEPGGKVGPIALGKLHPHLAQRFYGARPGQLWAPMRIDKWIEIVRLEAFLPVQLDESMRQMLLNELLEHWLQDQLSQ